MTKVYRTPEELVQIYRHSREGMTVLQIAEKVGLNYASVSTALYNLNRYLTGKTKSQGKHSLNYRMAVKIIRKQDRTEDPRANDEAIVRHGGRQEGDNFTFLKNSLDKFQHAVSTFIEVEINSRYSTLLEENRHLREENEQLKRRVEEMRNINWIDSLRDKLTPEDQQDTVDEQTKP